MISCAAIVARNTPQTHQSSAQFRGFTSFLFNVLTSFCQSRLTVSSIPLRGQRPCPGANLGKQSPAAVDVKRYQWDTDNGACEYYLRIGTRHRLQQSTIYLNELQ